MAPENHVVEVDEILPLNYLIIEYDAPNYPVGLDIRVWIRI
jgi:hypothetical protein